MRRLILDFILLTTLLLTCIAFAQEGSTDASATCNFNSDKQLVVGYQPLTFNLKKGILGREIPYGKVWAPGGKPMTLFTNSPIQIAGRNLPIGAYTMFVLPTAKQWTLIVSKSPDTSGKYDEAQDLVRVTMDSGELPSPQPNFTVSFLHIGPGQCSLRLDVATAGRFAVFQEQ